MPDVRYSMIFEIDSIEMKRITRRGSVKKALMILLFIIHTQGFSQWYSQESPVSTNLKKVYFANELEGWIVGDHGVILHTDNGGDNWFVQTSNTSYHLWNMSFTSNETGWVVGGGYGYQGGTLLHTSDGGTSWTTEITDPRFYSGVSFTSLLNGWVLPWSMMYDSLLHTTDGGVTWQKQLFFPGFYIPGGNNKLNIFFLDSLHGWIIGYRGGPMSPGADLFRTIDGGDTWIEGYYDVQCLRKIYFTDLNHGWACGMPDALSSPWGTIIFSSDGVNWNELFPGYYRDFNDITFIDSIHGWTVTDHGDILVTEDGGVNWEHQYGGVEGLNGIFFLPSGARGWAVGRNGTILTTDNGGFPVGTVEEHLQPKPALSISPNPASTHITIETPPPSQLSILNLNGQELLKQTTTEPKTVIDISTLPNGIYFVKVTGDKAVGVGKFMKQ